MGNRKAKRAAKKAGSAAEHTRKAAADLGSAATRMASATATLAGMRAKQTGGALVHSPAAQQVRGKARDVGETAGAAADRWRKRGRRAVTVGMLAGVGVLAQQVRSQPVPPHVQDE
jgi:hypothetical protein